MSQHIRLGKKGERLAAQYLIQKGYDILERNYRAGRIEMDIIALKNEVIVFVEVKARKNAVYALPEEAVNAQKEENLTAVAEAYLQNIDFPHKNVRFDIISIIMNPYQFEHFEDVF